MDHCNVLLCSIALKKLVKQAREKLVKKQGAAELNQQQHINPKSDYVVI